MTDDPKLGFTLSSEEHGPDALVDQARRAEAAGFDFLSISDHFHPWVSAQGESPFVWSTLGGVATATEDIEVGVGVTAPIMRIHPVNVAQATATVAEMLDGRFTVGVGTGELLNEHVTGEQWPEHAVRLAMLEEAVEVICDLWTGDQTSFHGEFYDVQNARLFTLPDETPPICVSAFGDRAAQAAADFGDGIWSVGPQDVVETWADAGGEGPRYTQIHACVADSEDDAVETVHEQWPNSMLPGELAAELPTTAHFEQACEMVREEDVRESGITLGRDADAHVESIQQCVDAGYDHVYVHQIGDDQEAAIEFYESEVFPSFR